MGVCQIQAKAHEFFLAQAKESKVKIAVSRGLWPQPQKLTQIGHEDLLAGPKKVLLGGWRQRYVTFFKIYVFLGRGRRERGKGDRVNPIPEGSNTSLPLKGSTDFWDHFGIILGSL